MDRIEIREYARKLARIESQDVSDDELDVMIDEGYDRVVMAHSWPWLKVAASEDIPMVPGTTEYVTIAAIEQVTTVVNIEQGYQLRSVSKNQIDRFRNDRVEASQPRAFYFGDSRLTIFPTPTTTDSLGVFYITTPLLGAGDNDSPPFNQLFHRILVDWSLHRLWEMDEDFEKSQEYRMRFEDGLLRMMAWYNTLSQDTPVIYGAFPTLHTPTNMPFLDSPKPI